MNNPKIIAHRGASFHAPENTISAIKKAIEMNSDMIEIDARLTKDNKIIIMHDPDVDRTTDGEGYVKGMTLEQIKRLRINNNEEIPTLQEVIDIVKGKCKLNIHIKEKKAVDKILKIIKDNDFHNEVLLSSFNEKTLIYIKEIDSRIKTGYLFRRPTPFYIDIGKRLGVDFLHPVYKVTTKRMVTRAQKYGFKVNVWTLKNKKSVLISRLYGVDGLITNDPLLYED